MHQTGFLAKIAFIGNLAFLLCIFFQRWAPAEQSLMISLLAILGLVLGMGILNPLSNIINGLILLRQKPLLEWVPRWLAVSNFCFLILQITYILHTWS